MFKNFKLFIGLFFIAFVFTCNGLSQTPQKSNLFETNDTSDEGQSPESYKLRRGEKQLNVEVGYSPFQPTFFAEKEYDTKGRSFALLTLRWGRNIGTKKGVSYEYQAGITPIALAFKNEVINPQFISAQTTPTLAPTVRQTTYGWAIEPAGFRFIFLPKKRLKPFAAAHAGFIFFKKPVPVPESTNYDFTGDFGGGLLYQIRRNKALSFGYKYYHISNMNIGAVNPGYNANVFYVGYSFFYK
ncbi:MAG: acyloxyacyl hydrolase [Acidobacteriota bacterium]|nr:acyloxyacyl hydrolase [Acidobacteriota bacterium]